MATGLTHSIHDGEPTGFERFLWRCARMMMPLVLMRDEEMDALPPEEFRASVDHHDKTIARLRAELIEVEGMDADAWQAKAKAEYLESVEQAKGWTLKGREIRARYEEMLARVNAWNPPTADHENLKAFMQEQLTESIRHDCHAHALPQPPDFSTWRADRITEFHRQIAREEKYKAEEIQRTEYRNAWLRTLRESVPYPAPQPTPAAEQ